MESSLNYTIMQHIIHISEASSVYVDCATSVGADISRRTLRSFENVFHLNSSTRKESANISDLIFEDEVKLSNGTFATTPSASLVPC